jgi:hypothetical protein
MSHRFTEFTDVFVAPLSLLRSMITHTKPISSMLQEPWAISSVDANLH